MKYRMKITLLSITIICCLLSCKPRDYREFQKFYEDRKSRYPKELVSHFPDKLPERGMSFDSPSFDRDVKGFKIEGIFLFHIYTDDKMKDKYLENSNYTFVDTIIISNKDDIIFLPDIRWYCDSVEQLQARTIYPFPDVLLEAVDYSNSFYFDKPSFENNINDYVYYLIEHKDTIMFEKQKTNSCNVLENKLDHGYSRGIVVNEKDKIISFWLYFW